MEERPSKTRFPARRLRHRPRVQRLPFLLLCLVTAGAWAVQIDFPDATPDAVKPAVLRGGDAWQGDGRRRQPGADVLAGPVTHVRDGDTIEVAGTAIRIANLDCAERGTSAGDRATQRMRELVLYGSVECQLSGRQSYDREVGTCRLPNGQELGHRLVAEGLCAR